MDLTASLPYQVEVAAHLAAALSVPLILVHVIDPSQEIVKLAHVRDARLIVMGQHSSGLLGPRMGSITYRVLCLAHALVLALPPVPAVERVDAHAGPDVTPA